MKRAEIDWLEDSGVVARAFFFDGCFFTATRLGFLSGNGTFDDGRADEGFVDDGFVDDGAASGAVNLGSVIGETSDA